jgi:hypothetical protein
VILTISDDIKESRRHKVTGADKKKFSPKLDIYVGAPPPHPRPSVPYPVVAGDPENSKYYVFAIRNQNEKSVPIRNLVMKLSFSDSVVRLGGEPGIGTIVAAPMRAYRQQTPDIMVLEQESVPAELSIFETFSFKVIKRKLEDCIFNTNMVVFSCSWWPAESNICYSGEVVTAPGGRREVSNLGRPGSYEGQFFYEIKGQRFSEKLSGKIVEK